MSRKKQNQKDETALDLSEKIGLTLLSDAKSVEISDWLPTKIPQLDYILGGGIPFGRVTEIYGLNSSGKSTLAANLTKNAQELGIMVVWMDIEGTMTGTTLDSFGIDPSDNIFLWGAEEGEILTIETVTEKVKQITDLAKDIDTPILLIWDSLAATPTDVSLEDGYNPNRMGVVAKAITNMVTLLGQSITHTNIAFVILNQARDDLKSNPMFPTIKSTGGRALEHWASLRLEVQKASQIKEDSDNPLGKKQKEYVGHIFRVKTVKSKVSTPNKQAEVYLISSPYVGVDFTENLYRTSVEDYEFITKGAWRNYTTLGGEEIKLRDKEWIGFLKSPEGEKVKNELFLRQLKAFFPNRYPVLDNKNTNIELDADLALAKKYYDGEDVSEYITVGADKSKMEVEGDEGEETKNK